MILFLSLFVSIFFFLFRVSVLLYCRAMEWNEIKIKWSLVCMYDMSFECYYDHNKQQFIHKTELILIAAAAVAVARWPLDLRMDYFLLLLYGEQITRCRIGRRTRNTIWISNECHSICAATRSERRFNFGCGCVLKPVSIKYYANYAVSSIKCAHRRGNFDGRHRKFFGEDSRALTHTQ